MATTIGNRAGPVNVTIRGPLFEKVIDKTIQRQIVTEAMKKFEKRVRRKGRKIGRKRNPIGPGDLHLGGGVVMELHSSTNWPRTTGVSWTRKNIAAIKSMSPRVLRKLAKEIVGELGG